jgi:hypothetical protein
VSSNLVSVRGIAIAVAVELGRILHLALGATEMDRFIVSVDPRNEAGG